MREKLTQRELVELHTTLCSRLDINPREVSDIHVSGSAVSMVVLDHEAKPGKRGSAPAVKTVQVEIVIDPDAESVADGPASGDRS